MAYKKSERDEMITISARDYHELINDHITLRALKVLGIEKCPKFKAIQGIMKDPRVETHIRPIDKHYR